MNNFLTYWINDFSTDMWSFWNVGYDRWTYSWGGYWTNFGITIFIIACLFYVLYTL